MTRTPILIAFVAAAALAACNNNNDDGTIVAGPADPMANAADNADIKLPPAIVASHKYRCKDNSLISIDWLSDGTANSARVTPDGGEAVNLAQAEAGGPYTAAPATPDGEAPADGPSLTGDPQAKTVTFAGKSCSR